LKTTGESRPDLPATVGQSGANREDAVRRLCTQTCDPPGLLDQICCFGRHTQVERFVALALLGHEIEEVPLRHQREEFAVRWYVAEIHHLKVLGADLTGQRLHLLMGQL
jgi:hypothetical protein